MPFSTVRGIRASRAPPPRRTHFQNLFLPQKTSPTRKRKLNIRSTRSQRSRVGLVLKCARRIVTVLRVMPVVNESAGWRPCWKSKLQREVQLDQLFCQKFCKSSPTPSISLHGQGMFEVPSSRQLHPANVTSTPRQHTEEGESAWHSQSTRIRHRSQPR